ncbi:MAG TPA: hypothetical protein VMM80_07095, partial [Bacteroidota bacterium]|nr:hypothetical protein [Bacteroidota bacterium]
MKNATIFLLAAMMMAAVMPLRAADSVDVTFRYSNPPATPPVLVGDFQVPTAWSNSNPAYTMSVAGGGVWTKTVRLPLGGNPAGTLPGTWQYKFYYPGAGTWPNDPLNHHVNAADQGNTFIYAKDPTIYQVLPNQRQAVQTTATPRLSAYIFPKVGSSVDTSSLRFIVDGTVYAGLGPAYDPSSGLVAYTPAAPLANGAHTMIVRASSTSGGSNADTVTFYTLSGFVVITSQGGYGTLTASRTLYGTVQGSGVTQVRIVRNQSDTTVVPAIAGKFTETVGLLAGLNTFVAL